MINTENTTYIKTHARFDSIEKAISRKPTIIETVLKAIGRENSEGNNKFLLTYEDSVINSTEDNNYILEIIIKKEFN